MDEFEGFNIDDHERVTVNTDRSKTLRLLEPITVAGEPIDEVTFARPKGKDIEAMDQVKGDIGKGVKLASQLSGLPMGAFRGMDVEDAEMCTFVASSFLGNVLKGGRKTGAI